MGLDVDREDVSVVLLVRDEALAARLDERVSVEDEPPPLRPVGPRREDPEQSVARIDEEDPVVAAIRDQQRRRQRPADTDRRVRNPGAPASALGRYELRCLAAASEFELCTSTPTIATPANRATRSSTSKERRRRRDRALRAVTRRR